MSVVLLDCDCLNTIFSIVGNLQIWLNTARTQLASYKFPTLTKHLLKWNEMDLQLNWIESNKNAQKNVILTLKWCADHGMKSLPLFAKFSEIIMKQ